MTQIPSPVPTDVPDGGAVPSRPEHRRGRRLRGRRFLLALAAVAFAGFLLRLGICFQLVKAYPPATAPAPPSDMWTYQVMARQVLDGTYDYSRGFKFQPFYYIVFLPAAYAAFGTAPGWLFLLQGLLAAGCIVLTGLTFSRLFGRPAGLAGAALLALARYHAFYTAFALLEVLQGFWMCLLAYLCVLAWQRRFTLLWCASGLVLGLSVVTRGNALLLAPVALAAIGVRFRRDGKRLVSSATGFLLLALLPGLPYAWVNARAFHRWIGPSSDAAQVLALGNSPEAPPGGKDPGTGAGAMEFTDSVREWVRLDHLEGSGRVPVSASILRWLRAEPLAWLELKFRVLLLFWTGFEIPNNVALVDRDPATGELAPVASPLLQAPFLLDFAVLGTLGLAGLALALTSARRRPRVAIVAGLLALSCLGTVIFYMLGRFRVPAVPWICGFGGYALARLASGWKQSRGADGRTNAIRRRKGPWPVLAVLAVSAVIVNFAFEAYRGHLEVFVMRWVRPDGVRVRLADRTVLRDNGPHSFGGWIPVEVPESGPPLTVRKEYVTKPGDSGTMTGRDNGDRAGGGNGSPALRFVVLAPAGGTLELQSGGIRQVAVVPAGLKWLAWEGIPVSGTASSGRPDAASPPAGTTVEISLRRAGPSEPLYLLFDAQRDYGRTVWPDGGKPPGEWVADLVLPAR